MAPDLQLCEALAQEWELPADACETPPVLPWRRRRRFVPSPPRLAPLLRGLQGMNGLNWILDKNGYPLRWCVAVVAGIIAGAVVAAGCEGALRTLYVPESEALAPSELTPGLALEPLPELALVLVLEGWVLAGLAGGIVCAVLAPIRAMAGGWVVGGALTLFAVASVVTNHHPLWFSLFATAVFIPSALAGALVARRW